MEKVVEISRKLWKAMQEVNVDVVRELAHENAEFVHMTRTLSREQEIAVLEARNINMKNIEFYEYTVRTFGTTEIILTKLDLNAVVRGNDVTNTFVVTEVYTPDDNGNLKLASLAFTKRVEA